MEARVTIVFLPCRNVNGGLYRFFMSGENGKEEKWIIKNL